MINFLKSSIGKDVEEYTPNYHSGTSGEWNAWQAKRNFLRYNLLNFLKFLILYCKKSKKRFLYKMVKRKL